MGGCEGGLCGCGVLCVGVWVCGCVTRVYRCRDRKSNISSKNGQYFFTKRNQCFLKKNTGAPLELGDIIGTLSEQVSSRRTWRLGGGVYIVFFLKKNTLYIFF